MKQERIQKGLWWDHAWSLVKGCTPVSDACDHCWLAQMEHRFGAKKHSGVTGSIAEGTACGYIDHWPSPLTDSAGRFNGTIRLMEENLDLPLRTRKPTVWAVWSDLFHEDVPDEFIENAFGTMALAQKHTFLLLTKRPARMADFYRKCVFNGHFPSSEPLNNVWVGTTVEDQRTADEWIPHLLRVPGNRFLSMEPLLGPVDLTRIGGDQFGWGRIDALSGRYYLRANAMENGCEWETKPIGRIDAVIVGGESGTGARPMHPDWVRSIRDQCAAAGVPFFVKQLYINGKLSKDMEEWPEDLKIRSLPWIR